jgi:hypothetical protein
MSGPPLATSSNGPNGYQHPPYGLDVAHININNHNNNSEPASELDADADADEDMTYAPAAFAPPPVPAPVVTTPAPAYRGEKIDLQAVDPVLYGLRRSVSTSFFCFRS